jgi:hypothetical protein
MIGNDLIYCLIVFINEHPNGYVSQGVLFCDREIQAMEPGKPKWKGNAFGNTFTSPLTEILRKIQ